MCCFHNISRVLPFLLRRLQMTNMACCVLRMSRTTVLSSSLGFSDPYYFLYRCVTYLWLTINTTLLADLVNGNWGKTQQKRKILDMFVNKTLGILCPICSVIYCTGHWYGPMLVSWLRWVTCKRGNNGSHLPWWYMENVHRLNYISVHL